MYYYVWKPPLCMSVKMELRRCGLLMRCTNMPICFTVNFCPKMIQIQFTRRREVRKRETGTRNHRDIAQPRTIKAQDLLHSSFLNIAQTRLSTFPLHWIFFIDLLWAGKMRLLLYTVLITSWRGRMCPWVSWGADESLEMSRTPAIWVIFGAHLL